MLHFMADILSHVGATVRALRTHRGFTIKDLAERSRVSRRFLVELENGRGNISISKLSQVADALGRHVASLLAPEGTTELVDHVTSLDGPSCLKLRAMLSELPVASGSRVRTSVALMGVRGSGKSTVGRALAQELGMEFVELDARIESASGLRLAEIFAIHGPEYYRELEHEAITALMAEGGSTVIATGGSLVTHNETWTLLRRKMRTVWLHAEAQELWDRVIAQGDHRPMEQNPEAFAQLEDLLELRMPLYQQSQRCVRTSNRSVDAVVSEVVSFLTGD